VSYPHLWGIEKTKWLHWNGNTNSVLARNIGQALGVGGVVNLTTFDTSVLIDNLPVLEQLAYRLRPPRWPAFLPRPFPPSVERGAALYHAHCASCHDAATADENGLLDHRMVPLEEIGTDPNQALEFARLLAPAGPKTPDGVSFHGQLETVLASIEAAYFQRHGTPVAIQSQWQGGRRPVAWRAPLAYRASPLAGAWAVAPYLHNNSVPTLYHLLVPARCRPARFVVGDRRFDPRHVGYVWHLADAPAPPAGCPAPVPQIGDSPTSTDDNMIFDAALPGNRNIGHEYGTALPDSDRWALVEYLKTL